MKKAPGAIIILHTCTKNHDHMIWHVMDLIVIFILGYFLPFYLFNSPKNQNLEKVKIKQPRNIIIL